jgi:hypothetical protein
MTTAYDPGADVLARYPDFTVRWRSLGGVPEATSRRQKVILIERGMSQTHRRCALAHAIAHLDLAHGSPICEGKEERQADELAAGRLIPLVELAAVLRWALGPDEVAHELDVTPRMVRRRVHALTAEEKAWIEAEIGRKEVSA